MKSINIKHIIITPNRQRQEFDPEELMKLTVSIQNTGLLHPPVLRSTPEGMILVAGERRLRAISDLWALGNNLVFNGQTYPEGMIPYNDLGELSHLEAEEAELEENLKRRDLTWTELAQAHERLHNLRTAQMEQAIQQADNNPETGVGEGDEWTVADTAEELTGRRDGFYQDTVRRELIVAKHLDNPAVAGAKNLNEAFKILKKEEEMKKNAELADYIGKTFDRNVHSLQNGNCLEWMRSRVGGSDNDYSPDIDVIITDPPYGMNAHEFGDGGGKMIAIDHGYDDSYESWQNLMVEWSYLSYQVCKEQAHAYVFCDFDRFHELKKYMEAAGWYVFRTPFICVKINSGRVPLPDRGPRRQYELCLYAIKGKKPVTHIYSDVISCPADEQLLHGAQKPVALYKNLLQRSVRPGDIVADFFCGTGTLFPAAHELKCRAIGVEQSKEYYAIAAKRLEELD